LVLAEMLHQRVETFEILVDLLKNEGLQWEALEEIAGEPG